MKPWTKEETDYLMDNWGKVSLAGISKHLNRSENAIIVKKNKLGLGAFLEAGDYISFNQLSRALGHGPVDTYMLTSWVKNRNFPVKYKRVDKNRFRVVYLSDFWKWADKNRNFVDFSKVPKNSLGKEPDWVKEQRKIEQIRATKIHITPWTAAEDESLKFYLKQFKYTYYDLSKMLGRTCGAIQHRICDLGLKERPIKVDNHIKWTKTEKQTVLDMIQGGFPYQLIAEQLGKSEKAIRGKVFVWFKTESLDKVRQILKG